VTAAVRFLRDLLHSFTWQKLLLVQLLALGIEIIAVLSFVMPFQSPPSFLWSRLVVDETVAFSIVSALLVARQSIARGVRPVAAYAIAVLAASVLAAVVQFNVRHWLGVYTNGDRPGVEMSRRRMQMVYAASDTLTYGVLFILIYLDYERRERLLRRIREAELDRARKERHVLHARLAAMRLSIDADALMTELIDLQRLFEHDAPDAVRRLDELVAGLRARVTQLDSAGNV
jgi:hypothetical protein